MPIVASLWFQIGFQSQQRYSMDQARSILKEMGLPPEAIERALQVHGELLSECTEFLSGFFACAYLNICVLRYIADNCDTGSGGDINQIAAYALTLHTPQPECIEEHLSDVRNFWPFLS
jgi:hypothetical protein